MNNWSDYPIFLAVAESGSLTAAGKSLGMSQPTVGRRIRALEDHFGTPLLRKQDGSLVPTSFGYSVLDHIRRMQSEASAIDRSSASLEKSLAGPVRISTTEGLGTHWLPFALQAFRTAHPDILVDLSVDFRTFNLAQREADIALRWMGPGNQNSLIGRKVVDAAFGLFASDDYLARRPEPILTKDDLVGHDNVVAQISETDYLWPKDENGSNLPFGRITFKSNNLEAHQNAIIAGYGVGILPLAFAQRGAGLTRIMAHDTHLEALWIVAHEDLKKSVRIRSVFDFLVDALQKDRDLFYGNAPSVFEHSTDFQCGETNDGSPDHEHVLAPRTLEPARP